MVNCRLPSYSSDLRRAVGLVTLTPKTLALGGSQSRDILAVLGFTNSPFQDENSVTAAYIVCDFCGVLAVVH